MEIITFMTKGLYDLAVEMAGEVWPMLKTAISFLLWVLSAIVILPCVYVASSLYPMWEEWGGDF